MSLRISFGSLLRTSLLLCLCAAGSAFAQGSKATPAPTAVATAASERVRARAEGKLGLSAPPARLAVVGPSYASEGNIQPPAYVISGRSLSEHARRQRDAQGRALVERGEKSPLGRLGKSGTDRALLLRSLLPLAGLWNDSSAGSVGGMVQASKLSIGGNASIGKDYFNIAAPPDGMIIQGSVGIGTTTPGSTLTVAGLIESTSGGIKFPDGTIQLTAAAGGGSGGVSNVTASSPLASSGGAVPNISLTGVVAVAQGGTGSSTGDGSALNNLNASALASGTVPAGRLTGSYNISISGNAASATTAGNVSGIVAIANGGTGTSSGPSAAGQYLRSTGAGTWGVGSIAAGDLPAALSNATLSINNNASSFTTNIGTGTTTGTVSIGGTGTQTINVGNGAGVKTVNLGSSNTTSTTTLLSGSGGLNLNVNNNAPTNIGTGNSTGAVSVGSSANTVAISSSNWSVSSNGVLSGLTGLTVGGTLNANGGIDRSAPGGLDIGGANTTSVFIGVNGPPTTVGGTLQVNGGLTAFGGASISSGASISGGLNNNGGGITVAGNITGVGGISSTNGFSIDLLNAGADQTLTITNSNAAHVANLSVEGKITAGGTLSLDNGTTNVTASEFNVLSGGVTVPYVLTAFLPGTASTTGGPNSDGVFFSFNPQFADSIAVTQLSCFAQTKTGASTGNTVIQISNGTSTANCTFGSGSSSCSATGGPLITIGTSDTITLKVQSTSGTAAANLTCTIEGTVSGK